MGDLNGNCGCGCGCDSGVPGNCGGFDNSCLWIILLLCCCGNKMGGFGCGDNSCLWIILLLCCCGGCGNNCGSPFNNGCDCC